MPDNAQAVVDGNPPGTTFDFASGYIRAGASSLGRTMSSLVCLVQCSTVRTTRTAPPLVPTGLCSQKRDDRRCAGQRSFDREPHQQRNANLRIHRRGGPCRAVTSGWSRTRPQVARTFSWSRTPLRIPEWPTGQQAYPGGLALAFVANTCSGDDCIIWKGQRLTLTQWESLGFD